MEARRTRGFTILEVLIVVAIVGMLAALVMVPMTGHLRGAEVEGAASRVQTTLSDAQAEARETGRPVRVVATLDEKGRAGLACHAVEAAPTAGSVPSAPKPEMEHAFARATRRVQLPTGVTIDGSTQEETRDEAARSMGGMGAMPAQALSGGREVTGPMPTRTLAIFLPDGSAVVSGPIRLSDKDGRSSEVRVNPWTGMAVLASEAGTDDSAGNAAGSSGREDRAGGGSDTADPFAEWR